MDTNSSMDGPGTSAPGTGTLTLNLLVAMLAQCADWRSKAPAVLRAFVEANPVRSAVRGRLRSAYAAAMSALKRLDAEIEKMRAAMEGGAPYRSTNPGAVLPRGPMAWAGAILCLVALGVLEASTALNIYGMCSQFLPKLVAALAATPVLVVPFSVKLLPQASPRSRIGIAVVSLVAALAFVSALCRMVHTADLGAFGLVLALQILADVLGLVCVSAVLAKITQPTPTEALRQELADSERRRDQLVGETQRLEIELRQLDAEEETAYETALVMVELEAAANDAELQRIDRMREKNRTLLNGIMPPGRN